VQDTHVRRGAALAVLSVAAATVAGALIAGPSGAGAGFALLGATRNSYRAAVLSTHPDPEARAEAGRSGIMAMIGFGLGGYLSYHAWKGHRTGPREYT
jgi:hypothetical protein